MSSKAPTDKVAAGTLSGAATIVLVWGLGRLGVDMPDYVAVAVGVLLTAGIAYIKTERLTLWKKGRHEA